MTLSLFACSKKKNDISQSQADMSNTQAENLSLTEKTTEKIADLVSVTESTAKESEQKTESTTMQEPVRDYCYLPKLSTSAAAQFGFNAFKEAIKESENALISPVSLMTALAITANGAKGDTLAQMEKVLCADIDSLNGSYRSEKSESDGVKIANSVWLNDKTGRLNVNRSFIEKSKNFYAAEVYSEKFDGATLGKINKWVSDNTDGMIPKILDEIPSSAVIYIVNTVLFDGKWELPFSSSDTKFNQPFTTKDGTVQKVTMLGSKEACNDKNNFRLGKTEVILKDYSNGYSFAAMLPDEGVTVAEALDSFTAAQFVDAVTVRNGETVFGFHFVELSIPKFEFECDLNFNEILKKLGMPLAFTESADFTGMATSTDGNIFIGNVFHKTKITFEREGTKAAAATAVEMVAESAAEWPDNIKKLTFDKPFIYVIFDSETGTPLFIGTVTNFEG